MGSETLPLCCFFEFFFRVTRFTETPNHQVGCDSASSEKTKNANKKAEHTTSTFELPLWCKVTANRQLAAGQCIRNLTGSSGRSI